MKKLKQLVSFPYQSVHWLRKKFQSCLIAANLFELDRLPAPVINIGNRSFGGTGKTPVTIYLAKLLAKHGYKVTVLSRAYKANKDLPRPILIDCSRQQEQFDAQNIGDEPMLMYQEFCDSDVRDNLSLALDKNRFRAGNKAYESFKTDIFLLDDGLQYITLHSDYKIILINNNESGFLRDFTDVHLEADLLLYTKVSSKWQGKNPQKNSVKFNLNLNKKLQNGHSYAGVFTAVADPKSLLEMIQDLLQREYPELAKNQLSTWIFPDHYRFSVKEVTEVLSRGIEIITTQKDLVKIPEQFRDQFVVAQLGLEFFPKGFDRRFVTEVDKLVTGGKKND